MKDRRAEQDNQDAEAEERHKANVDLVESWFAENSLDRQKSDPRDPKIVRDVVVRILDIKRERLPDEADKVDRETGKDYQKSLRQTYEDRLRDSNDKASFRNALRDLAAEMANRLVIRALKQTGADSAMLTVQDGRSREAVKALF